MAALELGDFDGEGRKCLVRRVFTTTWSAGRSSSLLLSDADNDGHFEATRLLSSEQAAPYFNLAKWKLFHTP